MGSVDSICAVSQYSACSYVRDRTFFSCIAYTDCSDYVLSSSCKSAGAILQASNYDIVFACSFIAIYRIGLSIASQSNRILKNTVSISTQRNAVCTKGMCIILSMLAYDNRIFFCSGNIIANHKRIDSLSFVTVHTNGIIVAHGIGTVRVNLIRIAKSSGIITGYNMAITNRKALFTGNLVLIAHCVAVVTRNCVQMTVCTGKGFFVPGNGIVRTYRIPGNIAFACFDQAGRAVRLNCTDSVKGTNT